MTHPKTSTRASLATLAAAMALALAACGNSGNPTTPTNASMATTAATSQLPTQANGTAAVTGNPPPVQGAPTGARFARVVAVRPITQATTTSRPRQVCHDEQVAVPETYKDKHQIGGAVVGGVIGALAGHQVGGGKGKKIATVGGAAAGALAGHEIQKHHQENNATHTETRNVCETVTDKATATTTAGYDVTYRLNGRTGHVRMHQDPGVGSGLPVRDGEVVVNGQRQQGNYYR